MKSQVFGGLLTAPFRVIKWPSNVWYNKSIMAWNVWQLHDPVKTKRRSQQYHEEWIKNKLLSWCYMSQWCLRSPRPLVMGALTIWGFSVPQIRHFSLLTYPPIWKWTPFENMIFFWQNLHHHAVSRWPNNSNVVQVQIYYVQWR